MHFQLKWLEMWEKVLDFAYFEVWSNWTDGFSSEARKKRFSAFSTPNMLQITKIPQTFLLAIMVSAANLGSKMLEISIFKNLSEVSIFSLIILQNSKIRQILENLVHFEIWAITQIFILLENRKNERYPHGFGRNMENVGKKINFFVLTENTS